MEGTKKEGRAHDLDLIANLLNNTFQQRDLGISILTHTPYDS